MYLKKKQLNDSVTAYKNEIAEAVSVILAAISSPGQRKKVLKDERVKEMIKKYNIVT